MRFRPFSPAGLCCAFLFAAALVAGGLGWVTVASLRVERAQGEAAARADRAGQERLALWRLDGHLLPTVGVENNRPFAHYTALHAPFPAVDTIQNAPAPGSVRLPSPLLSADLPPWMLLHFQIDPDAGWDSPQVIPADLAAQLQDPPFELSLANVTAARRDLLAELQERFPAVDTVRRLAEFDRAAPDASPFVVPVPLTDETAVPKPDDASPGDDPAQPRPAPRGQWLIDRVAEAERLAAGDRSAAAGRADAGAARPSAGWFARPLGEDPALRADAARVMSPASGPAAAVAPPEGPPLAQQQVPGPPLPAPQTAVGQAAQLPAYGFNRAAANAMSGVAGGKAVEAGDQPEYQARRKATQQSLDQRGGYQNTTQLRNYNLPATPGAGEDKATAGPTDAGIMTGQDPARDLALKAELAKKQADEQTHRYSKQLDEANRGSGAGRTEPEMKPDTSLGGVAGGAGVGGSATPGFGGMPGGAPGGFNGGFGGGGFGGRFAGDLPRPGAPGQPTPLHMRSTAPAPTMPPAPAGPLAAAKPAAGRTSTTAVPAENEGLARDRKELAPAGPVTPPGSRKRPPAVQPVAVHLGPLRPRWLTAADGTDVLVLVRAAQLDHKKVYQGVLLDWPGVRESLREQVADLFPAAELVPVHAADPEVPERSMTALPVQLAPGPAPDPDPPGLTPLRVGLALAWAAAVVALTAAGVGGRALVGLSERRIRFVSAVTHELRTPLTSLRLYLDLLTSGMITDEAKQKEYLHTLAAESDRLNRLIENVLDFAKLEKRSVQAVMQPTTVADLLDQVRQTWADRCAADGKELVVVSTLPPDRAVVTDPRMAAQILGNLVDNARKYARGSDDPRVWVWAKPGGRGQVVFEVEDRGPGVPAAERVSVFRPFRRGHAADAIAGGAGLGLALAKHWADLLGGRLSYRPADGGTGACFRLELPACG